MNVFDHVQLFVQTHTVLPAMVFVAVVVGLYWLVRPIRLAPEPTPEDAAPPTIDARPKEQRTMWRRSGNPIEIHVATHENKEEPSLGSVIDRSMGGMRLTLYAEVALGSLLSIRPVRADSMVPWVDLEVRSCVPSEDTPGCFEVGCKYVKSPPYSIQLLFG